GRTICSISNDLLGRWHVDEFRQQWRGEARLRPQRLSRDAPGPARVLRRNGRGDPAGGAALLERRPAGALCQRRDRHAAPEQRRMSRAAFAIRALTGAAAAAALASCIPSAEVPDAVVQPIPAPVPSPAPAPMPSSTPTPLPGPTTFLFQGEATQGGWIRGQAPAGTVSARLGEQKLALDAEGRFFAAFDRDAGPTAQLVAQLANGRTIASPVTVSPRAWNIEHVDVARRPGGPSEAFMKIRRPELEQIYAARAVESDIGGWRQDFIWPV